MATLLRLVDQGFLRRVDIELGPGAQPERVIYATKTFCQWADKALPAMERKWNSDLEPIQQVDALFADFVSGEAMVFGEDLKELEPVGDGIFELRTADVRIFGWFPAKDTFVAVSGADATWLKSGRGNYAKHVKAVWACVHALNLDEPKLITGGVEDVISTKA